VARYKSLSLTLACLGRLLRLGSIVVVESEAVLDSPGCLDFCGHYICGTPSVVDKVTTVAQQVEWP
jgi:hypothetical protein